MVKFDYPTTGWSTGKMRKRGQQFAADVRRGRPELEEPGIAEAEKLAGASRALSARGGMTPVGRVEQVGGGTPMDLINQHKDQLAEATDKYTQGDLSVNALKKLFAKLGWQADVSGMSVVAKDPNGEQHTFGQEAEAR